MLQVYLDNVPRHNRLVGCLLFPADWVVFGWGADPAAAWRRPYRVAEEVNEIIASEGGYLAIVEKGLRGVGWEATDRPDDGDIGVLEGVLGITDDKPVIGRIGAIHQAGRWIVRCAYGLRYIEMPALAAWRGPGQAWV